MMSVIAVMVNCALIGFTGLADRLLPEWPTINRIVIIVVLEVNVQSVKGFRLPYIDPDKAAFIEYRWLLNSYKNSTKKTLHLIILLSK